MSKSAVWYLVKWARTKFATTASNPPSRNGRSMASAPTSGRSDLAVRPTRSIPSDSSIPDHDGTGVASRRRRHPGPRPDVEHALARLDPGDLEEVVGGGREPGRVHALVVLGDVVVSAPVLHRSPSLSGVRGCAGPNASGAIGGAGTLCRMGART